MALFAPVEVPWISPMLTRFNEPGKTKMITLNIFIDVILSKIFEYLFNFHYNIGMLHLNMPMMSMRGIQLSKNVSDKQMALALLIMELNEWFRMKFWSI